MFEVALCCALGLGTQQNTLGYARWINDAVAAGNTSAEVAMGVGLMTFPIGPTDKEQGKQHIAKAAAAGNFDGVFWDGLVNSNSPREMTAQLRKAAAAGQPDALISLVENGSGDPHGRTSVMKALKMMGNPFMIARIIDPTLPGGFYHKNLFPDLAWNRLREMADNGSAEAARLVGELKAKGKAP
jgi:TPR repeat protein